MKSKLLMLFWTSRPISWVNTAYPFAAGYIMMTRSFDMTLIIGTIFFLIPYNLLMYGVNDVFDYESDIRNPRKGGVEGAVVAKANHKFILWSAAATTMPFVAYLLYLSPTFTSQLTLLIVVALVLAYSVPRIRAKERPIIDSITSSCHFAGPFVYACTFTQVTKPTLLIIAAFFLWGMASHAFGAIQDIIADRAAGLQSVATVLGAARTAQFALVLYVLAGLILLPLGWPGLVGALLGLGYVSAVWPYRFVKDREAESTNKGWKKFIVLNLICGFLVTLVLMYLYKTSG